MSVHCNILTALGFGGGVGEEAQTQHRHKPDYSEFYTNWSIDTEMKEAAQLECY